jgi:TPR repeat protein
VHVQAFHSVTIRPHNDLELFQESTCRAVCDYRAMAIPVAGASGYHCYNLTFSYSPVSKNEKESVGCANYVCFNKGRGAPRDYNLASKLYRRAAEQGSVGAQFELGKLYYDDKVVTQDYKQALVWYSKAVEQGNAQA